MNSKQRLAEAVRIRLMADVPLGAFLSGGTDSSTIVALMARASPKPVKTFSIGFRHADFNEAPYARMVAEQFGTEHHELILEPNVVETVETLWHALWKSHSAILPCFRRTYVSCLARKYVTVVLSGDGGDEAFAGYDRYRIHLQDRSRFPIPDWAGRWYREASLSSSSVTACPGRNVAYSISLPWSERYIEAVSLLPYQRNFTLLSDDFVSSFQGDADPIERISRVIWRSAPARDPLSQRAVSGYQDLSARRHSHESRSHEHGRIPGSTGSHAGSRFPGVGYFARSAMEDGQTRSEIHPHQACRARGRSAGSLASAQARIRFAASSLDATRTQRTGVSLSCWIRRTLQRGYFNEPGVRRLLDAFFRGQTNDYCRNLAADDVRTLAAKLP